MGGATNTVKKAFKDVGNVVKKPVSDAGGFIEKARKDTGKAIEKGVRDYGKFARDYTGIGIFDSSSEIRRLARDMDESRRKLGEEKQGYTDTDTDTDTDTKGAIEETPSFGLDLQAARRRKRALSLRKGFLSTIRAGKGQDEATTLSPSLGGKTKLGQ